MAGRVGLIGTLCLVAVGGLLNAHLAPRQPRSTALSDRAI